MSAVGHVMLGTMDVHHHWTKVRKSLKTKQTKKRFVFHILLFQKTANVGKLKKNFES